MEVGGCSMVTGQTCTHRGVRHRGAGHGKAAFACAKGTGASEAAAQRSTG